jgi:hypothetical protein
MSGSDWRTCRGGKVTAPVPERRVRDLAPGADRPRATTLVDVAIQESTATTEVGWTLWETAARWKRWETGRGKCADSAERPGYDVA